MKRGIFLQCMTIELTHGQLEFKSKVYGTLGWVFWWLTFLWILLKALGVI